MGRGRRKTVSCQQRPIQFDLHFGMGQPTLNHFFPDQAVTADIQRKMAQHAIQIGQILRPPRARTDGFGRKGKKRRPRLFMLAVSHRADAVFVIRFIIKQNIRPVQSNVVQLRMGFHRSFRRTGKPGAQALSRPEMSVG